MPKTLRTYLGFISIALKILKQKRNFWPLEVTFQAIKSYVSIENRKDAITALPLDYRS